MTEEIDLKQIEKKAYTSYHQDGLIDIMIGIALVFFALFMFTEMFWLGGAIVPILIPVYISAKQKFSIPRIGYAKFGTKGKGLMFTILGIFIMLAFLGLLFGLLFADPIIRDWIVLILGNYHNLIIGGVAAGLCLLMAISTAIKRFYIYATFILVLYIFAHFIGLDIRISVLLTGSSFIVLGIFTLVQFIKENPLPEDNKDV